MHVKQEVNKQDSFFIIILMLIHVKKDVTLHVKMTMPDSQRYPSNLYMINNVEDIIVS